MTIRPMYKLNSEIWSWEKIIQVDIAYKQIFWQDCKRNVKIIK